jgi:hypothetical protein
VVISLWTARETAKQYVIQNRPESNDSSNLSKRRYLIAKSGGFKNLQAIRNDVGQG